MGFYRAQVTLEPTTAKAEDVVVNTWHFIDKGAVVAPGDAPFERIRDVLRDFYTTAPAGGQNLGTFIAPSVTRATPSAIAITRRPDDFLFDPLRPGGPMREVWGSPSHVYDLVLPAQVAGDGGQSLPAEVAAVVSFHSAYGARAELGAGGTRPKARKRGRIYFGPLVKATIGNVANGTAYLFVADGLKRSADRLKQAGDGELDIVQWATYSTTEHDGAPVIGGFVDDAADTVRRRGVDAQSRITFGG
jgi:hypothetical protein